jgi:hypothetical protein
MADEGPLRDRDTRSGVGRVTSILLQMSTIKSQYGLSLLAVLPASSRWLQVDHSLICYYSLR